MAGSEWSPSATLGTRGRAGAVLGGMKGRGALAPGGVAKQALPERSEGILLSDRQRAEGFRDGCGQVVAKLVL
ncbi:MAG: hypothetical protein ACI8U4_001494 [Natronomonas sp.]|jgi:hypothetical protein